MIEKEANKSAIHGDETIDKMTKELSEAKREIVKIKKEKDGIAKELSFLKSKQSNKDLEFAKVDNAKANLNKELKQAAESAEKNLKVEKKAVQKLNEKVRKLDQEIQSLKSAANVTENELNVLEIELKNLNELEKKTTDENRVLREKVEKRDETYNQSTKETFEEKLKIKNMEIKSLMFSRKVSVDNGMKLQRINQQLEKEVKDLKVKLKVSSKESKQPFPCDKCDSSYKTAGLLIRHVKTEHENLPASRP